MSSEEKQLLFGEYAAGRISAADKRRLMAAALEDQDLFDAIAEQEELSELTVVLPAPKSKQVVWPFLMTAAATGAVALGLFLMLRPKPEAVVEMAKAVPPPREMTAPPAVSMPPPAPERKRAPAAAPVPMAEPPTGAAAPVTAPVPAPAPAPAQELAAAPELELRAKKAEMAAPQVATMAAPALYQVLHRDPEGPAQMVDGEPLVVRYRAAQAGRIALVETGSGRELAAATAVAGATVDLPFTAVRGAMNLEVRRAEVAFAAGRMADRSESRAAAPAAAPKAAPARGPEAPVRISLTIR